MSLLFEREAATRVTPSLAGSLFYQGAVIAGFNFIVNSFLYKLYLASAIATCFLATPIFGVIIATVLSAIR